MFSIKKWWPRRAIYDSPSEESGVIMASVANIDVLFKMITYTLVSFYIKDIFKSCRVFKKNVSKRTRFHKTLCNGTHESKEVFGDERVNCLNIFLFSQYIL